MRVIEPHHFNKLKKKRQKRHIGKKIWVFPVLGLVLVGIYTFYGQYFVQKPQKQEVSNANQITEQDNAPSEPPRLRELTDDQFKELYTSFAYPNTQPLTTPPSITGNKVADERIQSIAEERGYVLSAVPVSSIVHIDEQYLTEDDLLQQNAKIGWDGLQQAAEDADIPLQITSAYRSIEFQRELFLRYMRNAGVTAGGVADGYSDGAIGDIMNVVAPPGYSRHHNGYTIDLACDGIGLYGFKNTSCYEWISKNNFEIAKVNGWIPSYPEEAEQQGPEPEPWEFIWVGTINLYE